VTKEGVAPRELIEQRGRPRRPMNFQLRPDLVKAMPNNSRPSVGVEIDASVKRMQADAAVAEEKLQKQLDQIGSQSWSALMATLTETRAAFDRAHQAAREAFKRAA
jgi:hypothetical protein